MTIDTHQFALENLHRPMQRIEIEANHAKAHLTSPIPHSIKFCVSDNGPSYDGTVSMIIQPTFGKFVWRHTVVSNPKTMSFSVLSMNILLYTQ
jgi:hypothetical protein